MSNDNVVIVTGGAGLIGSNLVSALNARGHENILIVDHLNHPEKEKTLRRLQFRDFLDKTDFRKRFSEGRQPGADTVFHLGACSSTTETDADYLNDNNLAYSQQLCEWSLRHNSRFIYASSAATYGNGGLGYHDDEALIPKLKPLNLYGRSKQDFDMWALENKLYRQITGLKYFNVFGPGENHKGEMRSVVHKAYRQILESGRLELFRSHRPDYEDGHQERDFVYVNDAVDVTLFFADHPEVNGIFNCGTGCVHTWLDLAHAVFKAMRRPPLIAFIDMPPDIRDRYQYHTRADIRKLRATGYPAIFTPLDMAVQDYIENMPA